MLVKACSACAGDYEDPDRSAWGPADEDADEEGGAGDAEDFSADG